MDLWTIILECSNSTSSTAAESAQSSEPGTAVVRRRDRWIDTRCSTETDMCTEPGIPVVSHAKGAQKTGSMPNTTPPHSHVPPEDRERHSQHSAARVLPQTQVWGTAAVYMPNEDYPQVSERRFNLVGEVRYSVFSPPISNGLKEDMRGRVSRQSRDVRVGGG